MRKLMAIAALIIICPLTTAAQISKAEHEVRAFVTEYDQAVARRDIPFLERVLPDDYVMTATSGRLANRAQVLAFFQQQRDKPSYRMISLKHENVTVRVVGDMAVVTNDYTSRTTPIDSPDAEPAEYRGRHTGVFEKRNGRWMVIAEQDTEQQHDPIVMERQVGIIGRQYHELMKRLQDGRSYAALDRSSDFASLKGLLADQYTGTSADGVRSSKVDMLESFRTNQQRLESAELLEQTVYAIDNSAVVETGKVRYVGTNAGKPFDVVRRYTTTWVSWSKGWQIIAHHTSTVGR